MLDLPEVGVKSEEEEHEGPGSRPFCSRASNMESKTLEGGEEERCVCVCGKKDTG